MEDARWTMPLSYGTERVRHPYYGPAGIRASRGGDATGPLPLNARRTTDRSGPDVRVGSYGVGCTVLRYLRAPGPAVGAVQA